MKFAPEKILYNKGNMITDSGEFMVNVKVKKIYNKNIKKTKCDVEDFSSNITFSTEN